MEMLNRPKISYDLAAKFMDETKMFSWAFKQDFYFFLSYLSEKKIDLYYALDCILYRMEYDKAQISFREDRLKEWKEKALKCPECGKAMALYSANTVPGNQVGEGYKSQWVCTRCDFSDFSKKSPAEWIKKLKIKGYVTERGLASPESPPRFEAQD